MVDNHMKLETHSLSIKTNQWDQSAQRHLIRFPDRVNNNCEESKSARGGGGVILMVSVLNSND